MPPSARLQALPRLSLRLLWPAVLAGVLAGCDFPGVYKLDIQQGNIVTQDMVNQLKPGMTKRQVRYIMGTPLLVDSFRNDRWDYFYSLKNSQEEYSQERLTLVFRGDQLVSLQGNFRPAQARRTPGQGQQRSATGDDSLRAREIQSDVQVYPIDTPPTPEPVPDQPAP